MERRFTKSFARKERVFARRVISRLQNNHRFAVQAFRHVLDRPRSKLYLALRFCQFNSRLEDYWTARKAGLLPLFCRASGWQHVHEYAKSKVDKG